MHWSDLSPRRELGLLSWALSLALLVIPAAALGVLAYHTGSLLLTAGAVVTGLLVLMLLRAHPAWGPPANPSLVVVYLVAVVWAWVPLRGSSDGVTDLVTGLLLLLAVGLFAVHDLRRTGAEPLRRARLWCRRIAGRRSWPPRLADCRLIPEAIALRDAIRNEPGPALALLSDPRPEVQAAALGALDHRPHWRPGEAELVLRVARQSREPAVRSAAVYALAGVRTPELIAALAGFLRDPAAEVRRAAAEALIWDAEGRWPYAREAVKEALADPRFADDGALFAGCGRLPAAAVADLVTWSEEHPPLARRAVLTVIDHFHSELLAADRPELGTELAAMLLDNGTSPALRVEIAALLRDHHLLTPDLLDRLTNPDQPAPIRLFAAELMLRINPHDPDGLDVLRGLARQPNRELSVQIAAVLQNVLGLEVGLPADELPAPTSRLAADVARRVMAWANGASPDVLRPTPAPRPGLLPGSRPAVPGLPPTPGPAPTTASANPLDDSLLMPPARATANPLDDSLLAPPPERHPLDESRPRPPDNRPKPPPRPGSSAVI